MGFSRKHFRLFLIAFTAVTLLSSAAHCWAIDEAYFEDTDGNAFERIDFYTRRNDQLLTPEKPPCTDPGADRFSGISLDWDCNNPPKYSCPIRYESLCKNLASACVAKYGNRSCRVFPDERLPRIRSRSENQKFLRQVRALFENKRKQVAEFCCRGVGGEIKKACFSGVIKTKLYVQNSKFPKIEPNVFTAAYMNGWDAVVVSDSFLYSAGNMDRLGSTFGHEFGHACQYAFAKAHSIDLNDYASPDVDIANLGFSGVLGSELNRCLSAKVKWGHVQPGYRQLEIFADAVMAYTAQSIFDYAYHCNAIADDVHADPKQYSQCFFDHGVPGYPPLSKRFCPASKGCLK